MASKIKSAKFVKDARLPERPPLQRNQARPAGLYLLELRNHSAHAHALLYRRKLDVATDPKFGEDGLPEPIKINHT
jgi:hypothetical protein